MKGGIVDVWLTACFFCNSVLQANNHISLSIRFPARLSVFNRLGVQVGFPGDDEVTTALTPSQLEIAEMGKPRLGEFTKCQITIRESKEFQVRLI